MGWRKGSRGGTGLGRGETKGAATASPSTNSVPCNPHFLPRRFVLISGSTLPLYDPLTFYQQLMHERGSRLGACGAQRGDGGEGWRDEMQVSGWR